ncbi:hypothetical protein ACW9HQ_40065, partial [Nocardia gipuzkoensis]
CRVPGRAWYTARDVQRIGARRAGGLRVTDVLDFGLNGAGAIEMYRGWVHPDIYRDQPPALLTNWSDDDIDMYCGRKQ